VALALEALLQIAAVPTIKFVPNTPQRLRHARTCYDHLAGEIGVGLHDALLKNNSLLPRADDPNLYDMSEQGAKLLTEIGIDLSALSKSRRKLACSCLDWSERKPHLGGALGALLLQHALKQRWFESDLDSRALTVTTKGKRQLQKLFDIHC
jgi:hypothetical protein